MEVCTLMFCHHTCIPFLNWCICNSLTPFSMCDDSLWWPASSLHVTDFVQHWSMSGCYHDMISCQCMATLGRGMQHPAPSCMLPYLKTWRRTLFCRSNSSAHPAWSSTALKKGNAFVHDLQHNKRYQDPIKTHLHCDKLPIKVAQLQDLHCIVRYLKRLYI